MNASVILAGVHLNLSTLFVVSHFSSAKVSPKWRLNLCFGTQNKCPFPLNRGVPSTEVTNTKIRWPFFRDQILCPLNGDVPKEGFHCSCSLSSFVTVQVRDTTFETRSNELIGGGGGEGGRGSPCLVPTLSQSHILEMFCRLLSEEEVKKSLLFLYFSFPSLHTCDLRSALDDHAWILLTLSGGEILKFRELRRRKQTSEGY